MASRKEQKELARAERLAKEQELAAQVGRTRRFQIFGGVTVAAVIVVVVLIAVSSGSSGGGGSSADAPTSAAAKAAYTATDSLLSKIPQRGTVLGDPNAPVTMTYFGDLECPICKAFTLDYFPQFVQDQVRTGKVKVDYRSFCTATCNDHSQALFDLQQTAAYAAGKQNLFWYYAELFYHEQQDETLDYVNNTWLTNLAKTIPALDVAKWQKARTADKTALQASVNADGTEANTLQISGTPALFMSGKKGTQQVTGPGGIVPTYAELAAAVQAVS
jgi:protein-disulfide isomerase